VKIKAKAIGKRVNVSSALPRLAVPGLLLADLLALEASLLLGWGSREVLSFLFPAKVPLSALGSVALAFLCFPVGYFLAGLYPGFGLAPVERVRRKVQVTFLMFLALVAWEWLFFREGWSRGVLALALGFALVLVP